ncbi:hypothetical protein XL92_001452 [Salmonella enterica subsp. enterica]|nr:hypothetical protein [Salmonella enterica subsp. enterica]
MSRRKNIENTLATSMSKLLLQDGFSYLKENKELVCYESIVGDWKYGFSFYLCNNKPPYSVFANVYLANIAYEKIICELLDDDKFFFPYISSWAAKFSDQLIPLKLHSEDDAFNKSSVLYSVFKDAEKSFLIPYSSEERIFSEFSNRRMIKWPLGGTINSCVVYLAAYGIKNNNREALDLSFDRAINMADSCQTDASRAELKTIAEKLISKKFVSI